jgi:hypothetical protein
VNSSRCDPGSRRFLSVDMWGSFLALFADPRTKTNFCSKSWAMVFSVFSRAWASTLVLSGGVLDNFMDFVSFDSIAFMDCVILISRASIRSVLLCWLESLMGVRAGILGWASRASTRFWRSVITLSLVVIVVSRPFMYFDIE